MKQFKILIIDDQLDERISLSEILVSNDYLVKDVMDGEEAFQILKDENIDLIFIEIKYPGRKNLMTSQSIKSNVRFNGIPIIFIVGHEDLAIIQELYQSGGDDYILKPFIWSELLTKARIHLELKYSRQMARNMNHLLEEKVVQRTNELEDSLNKLRQANKELDVLEIAKSEFFNLISHEIRTPLNGILGSLTLINRYKLPAEVNRYFTLLDLSVKRLEEFSNTILEASILRVKGAKAIVLNDTDLADIVQSSINLCVNKFSQKNIRVNIQNSSSCSVIKGDRKYLLKCFTAVLDNAFKFSPENEKLEITIKNEPLGYLKIVIADQGVGFSKIALENIFNSFANLNEHFDKNTGMGLHLAKLIIDAHSGSINANNIDDGGAEIQIVIPSGI